MMLNTKKRPLMAAALLLTSLGIATSCIDKSYDLDKDIDMTINAGGEYLAIPVGYTEKITLDKIIELEEGDDLQVVDGEYHLLKSGTVDNATTDVKNVTVKGSTTLIDATEVVNVPSIPQDEDFRKDINKANPITANANDIDQAVKEIGSLAAETPAELRIELRIDADASMNYDQVEISDLKITFPGFLDFEADGNLKDNVLTIPSATISKGGAYTRTLRLAGYKFGSEPKKGKVIVNQSLAISENVTVEGTAKVNIKAGSSGKLSVAPRIILSDMSVASITGIIQPEIEETGSTVDIESLPDFLQDDATELDIDNPVFTFIATNPLEAPVTLNGKLSGKKDGATIDGSAVIIGKGSKDGEEIILRKGKNVIALSRQGKGGPEGATNVKVSDINNLIKKIPDVVSVTLQPAVESEEYYTVRLGETYSMESSYDIDIPLSFGSNLKIVYEETIDDLDLDLEDVDIKKAILSINAVNTIPLAMEIKKDNVSALDAEGNVIEDIEVTVEGTIAESKDGKAEAASTLSITLEEKAEGAISKLDGLKLKVTAVPGQATGILLLSSQWLQLKDMKLRIPNGIKVDLN